MPTTEITTITAAIFVSLELSRSTWLITALSAPLGPKVSRHQVRGGDVPELLKRFTDLQRAVQRRTGADVPMVVIQDAGLDGLWIHRALGAAGIESHVVDPASIAVSRRHRRAKTDRIDGEALVRTLMAWKRGEPRVCAMVPVPTPEEEDRRRACRDLKSLIGERIRHVNRVKGLLFAQGIGNYEPRNKNRRHRLEELCTGDGRPLPPHLKALVLRELEIIELLNGQIEIVKAERDALLAEMRTIGSAPTPVRMLLELKGIGPGFAGALWSEGLLRTFENRRQLAAYAGLAPTPWKSGTIDHEQGVSKAGNPRLRAICVEMAWLWLRHQPGSALARWFHDRAGRLGPRARKVTIRVGAEASGRLVEIRDERRCHRGCGHEDGVTPDPAIRNSSVPPGNDQPRRIRADGPAYGMAQTAVVKKGPVFSSPDRRMRDDGAAAISGDRM